MGDPKIYAMDETLGMAKARMDSAQHGVTIKCKRRRPGGGMPPLFEHYATFMNVAMQHIVTPESWLSLLAGGGEHAIDVYDPVDIGKILGGPLRFQISGPPKSPIDFGQLERPDWPGPVELTYPSKQELAQAAAPQPISVISSAPGMPAVHVGQPAPVVAAGTSPADLALAQARAELAQRTAEIEALRDTQRALASRLEREETQRVADAKLNALEHRLSEALAKRDVPPPPPPRDMSETLTPLLGALAPILTEMVKGQAEARKEALAMQMKMQELQLASAQQFQTVLVQMTARPAVDPAIVALQDKFDRTLERMHEREDPAARAMVTQMADAMGSVTNMMMGVLQTASEAGLVGGGKETTGMMVIKEIAKALDKFGRVAAVGMQKPQLRPGRPPQPQRAPRPNGAPRATAPANVVVEAPVARAPQPATPQPAAFAGMPVGAAEAPNPFDEIEDMILAEADVQEVADKLVGSWSNPVLQAEIAEHGGDFTSILQDRIEEEWADEHVEYLLSLSEAVQAKLVEAGLLVPTEGDEAEAETEIGQ